MIDFNIVSKGSPSIDVDEAKRHVKAILSVTAEDDGIETMIAAAEEYAENFTGRSLSETVIEAYPKTFSDAVELPRSPVIEVQSVNYIAPDGTERTIDASAFTVVNQGERIVFSERPETDPTAIRPITIRYKAGYTAIPFAIRQAMLLMIGHWYVNRESVITGPTASIEVDMTTRTLLKQYRVRWF